MSYQNFIPTVWAEAINRELERAHVFVEDTNKQYEGSVSKAGDTVRILGVGKPTITEGIGSDITLVDPEEVADSSVTMLINRTAYYNYMIDDIDKRQAVGGVMDALSKEASEGLAQKQDVAVSQLALSPDAKKLDKTVTTVTADNVLAYLDSGIQTLYENDVTPSTEITVVVPPWFLTILKQAYTKLDTDNSEMIANGRVGKYGNVVVKMSNNVATDTDGNSYIQMKTKRAIAFASPMTHVEPYRPEKRFSDAVKGFVLYGTKIVRPKEMIILNCKKSA